MSNNFMQLVFFRDAEREFDFLSSIELCVLDQADLFTMQNFEHVSTVMSCINLQPVQASRTDFARVHDFYLNDWCEWALVIRVGHCLFIIC